MMPRAKYRQRLPQLDGGVFLTDGGLETTLTFHEGWELPCGEAFILLDSDRGRQALHAYFDRYVPMALALGAGFVLESPTWRANSDWAEKVDYGRAALGRINHAAIDLMAEIRARYETPTSPMVISGCIGPRGDGYNPGELMSPGEAKAYHASQIGVFREASADFVSTFTMTNSNEACGIAQAADIAFVFYARHGAQVSGENYILPLRTSRLRSTSDASVTSFGVNLFLGDMHQRCVSA
jgi:homocysteine S-methyltransferase